MDIKHVDLQMNEKMMESFIRMFFITLVSPCSVLSSYVLSSTPLTFIITYYLSLEI